MYWVVYSPIEQFEIFFLNFPMLSEMSGWVLPLSEGVSLVAAENIVWVLLFSSWMMTLGSEQTDSYGLSLELYIPILVWFLLKTGAVWTSLGLFLVVQEMFSQTQRSVYGGLSGFGGTTPTVFARFFWWNFEVVSLFPRFLMWIPVWFFLGLTNMLSFSLFVFFFLGTFLIFWVVRHPLFSLMYRIYVVSMLGALGDQSIETKHYKYGLLLIPIFLLILVSNLMGMLPYNYTLTSHICFTFTISMSFFIGINLVGLMLNRENLLLLFLPGSAPLAISVFLVFIETLSYLARMLSLAIRLFANVVAGHILLKILSNFLLEGLLLGGYVNLFIIAILQSFFFLETGVAFLQAYIFFTLCTIYLKDTVSDTTHH